MTPALLLTGATGLVGSELLEHLLAGHADRRIILLTRQPGRLHAQSAHPGITVIQGDLRDPGLGLTGSQWAGLERCLTEIIHCAAQTRFDLPLEEARAANVACTENLLKLASRCRRLEKFVYLSTVYVAGRTSGRIPEAPLRCGGGFLNTYQQSKQEAEELVVRYMKELPAAIFRLSSIIGDSRTGRVRQFNYVHQLLKLFPRNALPMVPGEPHALVDLIPTDWAISALAWLIESSFVPGRIYQVCGGPEDSLTVPEMIELTKSLVESHPKGMRWAPIRVPDLVQLSEYEAFVEKSRRDGDRLLNELLRVLGLFLPHLGIFQAFENRLTKEALAASGLRLPAVRDTYAKVVSYCLETDWGRC